MQDGKNWFEEKVTAYQPNEVLTFELMACSFPVNKLKYTYTLTSLGDKTKVMQMMEYRIKFGLLGKILDSLMIRKQYDAGIKGFFTGLKIHVEKVKA